MCKSSIYEARNNFSALVKLAEGGEPVELTRHDKPVAVIISYDDWEARKPKKTFWDSMLEIRAKYTDVLMDPTWEGLPIEKDQIPDEGYEKKIDAMWGGN